MAKQKRQSNRSRPSQQRTTAPSSGQTTGPGGRRLGQAAATPRPGSGAARRDARRQSQRRSRLGWISVGVVVVVVAVLIVVRLTGSSTPSASTSNDSAGRNPAAAPATITQPVETVPASVFNSVSTGGEPPPFVVTKDQPKLTSGGLPQFVYVGAEYCPYCAVMRWSLVAALSRFGTFSGLKESTSASDDGNVPTFSFLGASYSSKYLTFSAYEESDRNQSPLVTPPNDVLALYAKYDGNGSTGTAFSPGGAGIPFIDLANKYVSSGDPSYLATLVYLSNSSPGVLDGGGPGRLAIAQAIHDPSGSVGLAIGASAFIVTANYLSAAICSVDGAKPASVCGSRGIKAAMKEISAAKPVG